MELDEQFMLGCFFQDLFLGVDHFLIIAVRKIHHHSFDPPFFKLGKGFFQLGINSFPVYPYVDANSFLSGVIADPLHVQAGHCLGDIGVGANGSIARGIAFIPGKTAVTDYRMVFDVISRTEINIVFIGLKVNARAKVVSGVMSPFHQ